MKMKIFTLILVSITSSSCHSTLAEQTTNKVEKITVPPIIAAQPSPNTESLGNEIIADLLPDGSVLQQGTGDVIVNGTDVKRGDFPSTIMFKSSSGGRCTATIVSENAALVAAHCGPYSGVNAASKKWSAWVNDGAGRLDNKMVCQNSPEAKFTYAQVEIRNLETGAVRYDTDLVDVSDDFSLCKFENPVSTGVGNKFERFASAGPTVGSSLLLIGYGCQSQCQLDEDCPRVYGELKAGLTRVTHTPGFTKIGNSRTDRFDAAANDAYVCPGDSGGAAYIRKRGSNKWSDRHIVGVNSMVGPGKDKEMTSFIANTSSNKFLTWARQWAQQNQAELCGITSNAKNCKNM